MNQIIELAIKMKEFYALPFVTVWKTGKSYNFNFDKKPVGYTTRDCGVLRTVVGVY